MPQMASNRHPRGTLEACCPLIQTLPTFLAEQALILKTVVSLFLFEFWTSSFSGPEIQMPPDELSDPNLTPLPTHPGIKFIARSPCCDDSVMFGCIPVIDKEAADAYGQLFKGDLWKSPPHIDWISHGITKWIYSDPDPFVSHAKDLGPNF